VVNVIAKEIERSREANPPQIPLETVKLWMAGEATDTMGATYAFVTDPICIARVVPPIPQIDATSFLRRYFAYCLAEDPKGEWADSRYSASWDIANMLRALAADSARQDEVRDWIAWVKDQYLKGAAPMRQAIETGVVEHILAEPSLRGLLNDWGADSALREAIQRSERHVRRLPG